MRSRDFPGNEPQRFVANYRKAGGEIALEYIEMERHAGHSPDLSQVGDMFDRHGGVRARQDPREVMQRCPVRRSPAVP